MSDQPSNDIASRLKAICRRVDVVDKSNSTVTGKIWRIQPEELKL